MMKSKGKEQGKIESIFYSWTEEERAETWFHCLHCGQFFKGKEVRRKRFKKKTYFCCPINGCDGGPIDWASLEGLKIHYPVVCEKIPGEPTRGIRYDINELTTNQKIESTRTNKTHRIVQVKRMFCDRITKGKDREYLTMDSFESIVIKENEPVPDQVFDLWIKRRFYPSRMGIAIVRFPGNPKEFVYPLYFHVPETIRSDVFLRFGAGKELKGQTEIAKA